MTDRELDAAIAEKVFGITARDIVTGKEHPITATEIMLNRLSMDSIPHYSTDIKCAWDVVEKLGDVIIEQDYSKSGFRYNVVIGGIETWADTAPRAICEAALAALK